MNGFSSRFFPVFLPGFSFPVFLSRFSFLRSEEEVVVGLLRDPVRRGRDAVVDARLARLAAREARRHQPDQHPATVGLLHLQYLNFKR